MKACGVLVLAAGLGLAAAVEAAPLSSYSGLLVLGDSLSDRGNFFALAGLPPAPYFAGRVSSGPVWAEYVADAVEAGGGTAINLAHAYARTDTTSIAPDLPDQLGAAIPQLGALGPNPLAALWFGANDIFAVAGTPDAVSVAEAAAQRVLGAIGTLAGFGVDDFLVFNLPDLSETPLYRLFEPAKAASAKAASLAFNAELAAGLAALSGPLDIELIDIEAIFGELVANPATYGVANATFPCLFPSDLAAAAYGQPRFCGAASESYAFFDSLHPSGTIHARIADVVAAELAPVPLPAGVPLLAAGLGLLGLAGRSRRA